jgi:phage/plasmid-associated DNA primase
MLSGYAKVAPSEAFISVNSNNDVRRAGFEGSRYVYCEEVQKYYSLNTEFIKTFASYGTKISARHMRQEPYDYTNTAKFIISANFPPKLGDTGASIKRRLVIVPFNINVMTTPLVRFKGNLELLLRNEYPGIFNWSLKGYKLYKYNGSLVLPESLEKYQSEYLEGNEILLDFIQEIITFQSDKKDAVLGQNTLVENNRPPRVKSDVVKKLDMYIAYRNWCVSKKEDKPLGKHLFHEELIQSLKKINDEVSIVKRDTGYFYKGISIKSIYMVEGGKI